MYSYDDIYGIDLDSYCAAHNTNISQMIEKTDIDIEILKDRMRILMAPYWRDQDTALIGHIYKLLNKKTNHKERLKEWQLKTT